jgi:hypothetical protein
VQKFDFTPQGVPGSVRFFWADELTGSLWGALEWIIRGQAEMKIGGSRIRAATTFLARH